LQEKARPVARISDGEGSGKEKEESKRWVAPKKVEHNSCLTKTDGIKANGGKERKPLTHREGSRFRGSYRTQEGDRDGGTQHDRLARQEEKASMTAPDLFLQQGEGDPLTKKVEKRKRTLNGIRPRR